MKIAPSCRVYLDSDKKKKLDELINQCEKNNDSLYLNLLKNGKHKPSKSEATWPVQLEDDEDIIIIGNIFIYLYLLYYFGFKLNIFSACIKSCFSKSIMY